MVSLVAKRYAEAFFRVGLQNNNLDILFDDVTGIQEVFRTNKVLDITLKNPKIPSKCKLSLLKDLFQKNISKESFALLMLVIKKSRQEFLLDIFESFVKKCDEHRNIVDVIISSADDIDDEYINTIKENIEKNINKSVRIEKVIDEQLIAGIKVKVDNVLLDRTLDGKINRISKAIVRKEAI